MYRLDLHCPCADLRLVQDMRLRDKHMGRRGRLPRLQQARRLEQSVGAILLDCRDMSYRIGHDVVHVLHYG